jgi:hypothetical protein
LHQPIAISCPAASRRHGPSRMTASAALCRTRVLGSVPKASLGRPGETLVTASACEQFASEVQHNALGGIAGNGERIGGGSVREEARLGRPSARAAVAAVAQRDSTATRRRQRCPFARRLKTNQGAGHRPTIAAEYLRRTRRALWDHTEIHLFDQR